MPLIGRAHEVERIGGLLAAGRPPVLVGSAGIGKTALARAVLDRLGPHRATVALASLRWRPLAPVARLLGHEPPSAPALAAAAIVQQARTPVLFDDLQWADDATFDVIGELVGRVPLVVTVRVGEEGAARALEILSLVGFETMHVDPLEPAAAAQLAGHLHPHLDPAARAELVRRAAGSPLLLAELGHGGDPSPSLASALLARLAGLGPQARPALERLAVLARPCDPTVLGASTAIEELREAGVVVDDGDQVALAHALIGEVLVEQLGSEADRIRLELVPVVGDGEAAQLLARAGRPAEARARALAAAQGAPGAARLALLELAIGCSGELDLDQRFELARLLVRRGRPAQALACCDEGLALADGPVARGTLLVAAAEARWAQGERERAMDLVAEAVVLLRGSDTAAEVLALSGRTFYDTSIAFDPSAGIPLAREAVAVADRIGAEQRFARWRLAALLQASEQDGWEEELDAVLVACDAAGDEDLRHLASVSSILYQWMSGDTRPAERRARLEVERLGAASDTLDRYDLAAYTAMLGLLAGDAPERVLAEHAGRLEEVPSFPARPFLTAAAAIALAEGGRYDDAAEVLHDARAQARGDVQAEALAAWADADVAWQIGRWDRAVLVEERLGGAVGFHPASVQARLLAAHGRVARGDAALPGEPPVAMRRFLAGAPAEWFALERWAAGDVATAAAGFRAAAETWTGVDERARWRCRWSAAECARLVGDPGAIEDLHVVEHAAARIGYRSLIVRTARSLRQAGSRPWAAGSAHAGGLTARELEVLDLVGMGMSTLEVAAALGVAASTVETVIASARRRLGVATRVAAVAELARLRSGISA